MSTSTRPVLTRPTPAQRENWRITDRGTAIYWPDIDEEFGLAGMLGVSEIALEGRTRTQLPRSGSGHSTASVSCQRRASR